MATERQYAFFRFLYDEEAKRTDILREHAKNNLGLVTLYTGFVLFVANAASPDSILIKGMFLATMAFMLASFLLSLWATQIADFEAPCDPDDIFESYGDQPPSDEDFFDDRIVDLSVAYEKNSAVNDNKAWYLALARYCLLIGITLHAGYVTIRLS